MPGPIPPPPPPAAAVAEFFGGLLIVGRSFTSGNIMPAGVIAPVSGHITAIRLHVGTAPAGGSNTLTVNINGQPAAALGLVLAAGQTAAFAGGLAVAITAGDLLTFGWSVGASTAPAYDVSVQLSS